MFTINQEDVRRILSDKIRRYQALPLLIPKSGSEQFALWANQKLVFGLPYSLMAVQQLEAGQYGICIDCGQEIPKRRLDIVPGAIRCIECQEREEKNVARNRLIAVC